MKRVAIVLLTLFSPNTSPMSSEPPSAAPEYYYATHVQPNIQHVSINDIRTVCSFTVSYNSLDEILCVHEDAQPQEAATLQMLAARCLVKNNPVDLKKAMADGGAPEPVQRLVLQIARQEYNDTPYFEDESEDPRLEFYFSVKGETSRLEFYQERPWFWIEPAALVSKRHFFKSRFPKVQNLIKRIPPHIDVTPLLCCLQTMCITLNHHSCDVVDFDYLLRHHFGRNDLKQYGSSMLKRLWPYNVMDALIQHECQQKFVDLFRRSWHTIDVTPWYEEAVELGWDHLAVALKPPMDRFAVDEKVLELDRQVREALETLYQEPKDQQDETE